jgi:hypothetical protein
MNAVNWIKRRVSLSTTSPTTQQSTPPELQNSPKINTNEQEYATLTTDNSNRLSSSTHMAMTQLTPAPKLLQHNIIDPSSPLSILAATSKLTTFPYGELQALNARMNMEASKLNGPSVNGVNGIDDMNGLHAVVMGGDGEENGIAVMKPLPRQRTRLAMERNNQFKHPATKSLLPSPIPGPLPSTQYTNLNPRPSTSSNPPQTRQVKQRNVTTSAIPRTQTVAISHKRSTSLSSTQNTRSSKRIKTSHPSPSTILVAPCTPPPKPIRTVRPVAKSKSQPLPPENKKRILPVRQGQVDILDGEISLLSTPQQQDSTSSILNMLI